MSGLSKRRLAPYPAGWAEATDEALEQLCASARSAPAARYPQEYVSGEFPVISEIGLRKGGVMRVVEEPEAASPASYADPMEQTVRNFAHQARTTGLPAIEAMVQLKGLLLAELGEGAPIDLHRVRRWFVEAYYFERDA